MRRTGVIAIAALSLHVIGCDSDSQPAQPVTDAAPPPPPPIDAAALALFPVQLDDAGRGAARPPKPARKTIQIILRSTPPGAIAAVDGKIIGKTPTYWEGAATGRAREFTFVLSGYGMARYRFVPIKSGVVHATLDRVMMSSDAGP